MFTCWKLIICFWFVQRQYKDYEIIDYYEDAGVSAKTGNFRAEFERLKEDIKSKKINTIISLKLDRFTRSIYD